MNATIAERLTLADIDPAEQAQAIRLARALAAAGDGEWTLAAQVSAGRVAPVDRTGCWLVTAQGAALKIVAIDGAPIASHPERVPELVAVLDRIDPLLELIEAHLGMAFEPHRAVDALPGGLVPVTVTARHGDGRSVEFALAVPAALCPLPVTIAPALHVHVPVRVECVAPSLTVAEASALGAGDLLILHAGVWRAKLIAPHRAIDAVVEPNAGDARASPIFHDSNSASGAARMNDPSTEPDPIDDDAEDRLRRFRVPVTVRLPDVDASIGDLAALAAGATIALGPVTAGLRVELLVAARVLAVGEIVRLGDRFAVLVDHAIDHVGALRPPVEENV